MKLSEKFQEWHDSPTNETVEGNIIELVKIADEYAIEFAEWLIDGHVSELTLKEFKRQKGL